MSNANGGGAGDTLAATLVCYYSRPRPGGHELRSSQVPTRTRSFLSATLKLQRQYRYDEAGDSKRGCWDVEGQQDEVSPEGERVLGIARSAIHKTHLAKTVE